MIYNISAQKAEPSAGTCQNQGWVTTPNTSEGVNFVRNREYMLLFTCNNNYLKIFFKSLCKLFNTVD